MKKTETKEEEDTPHGFDPQLGEWMVMTPNTDGSFKLIDQSHSDVGAWSKAFKHELDVYYIAQCVFRIGVVDDVLTDDQLELIMKEA